MPIYTFKNNETGDVWDELMSISSRSTFLEENPHITTIIEKAPGLVGSRYTSGIKNDDGWNENLNRIAEAHPTSNLADRYGSKDTTASKTRDAVKKWRKQTDKN
jgi:hypothetical protein